MQIRSQSDLKKCTQANCIVDRSTTPNSVGRACVSSRAIRMRDRFFLLLNFKITLILCIGESAIIIEQSYSLKMSHVYKKRKHGVMIELQITDM